MKLTVNNRQKVRKAIMAHAFAGQLLTLAQERQKLAYLVYGQVVDVAKVEHLKAPWVTRDATSFRVAYNNDIYGFDTTGQITNKSRPFINLFGAGAIGWWTDVPTAGEKIILPHNNAMFSVQGRKSWVETYFELGRQLETLTAEMTKRSNEVTAILNQYRTTEKLLAAWPEIASIIPEDMNDLPENLPAPSDLNDALGLPPK